MEKTLTQAFIMWDNFFKLHVWLATYLCLYPPHSWLCDDVRGGMCIHPNGCKDRMGYLQSPFWFSMTSKLELLSDKKCWKSCHVGRRGISQVWTKKGIQEHLLHVPMEFVLWRKRGPTTHTSKCFGKWVHIKGGGGGLDVHQISNQSVGIYI
jgi:hypothetical protein